MNIFVFSAARKRNNWKVRQFQRRISPVVLCLAQESCQLQCNWLPPEEEWTARYPQLFAVLWALHFTPFHVVKQCILPFRIGKDWQKSHGILDVSVLDYQGKVGVAVQAVSRSSVRKRPSRAQRPAARGWGCPRHRGPGRSAPGSGGGPGRAGAAGRGRAGPGRGRPGALFARCPQGHRLRRGAAARARPRPGPRGLGAPPPWAERGVRQSRRGPAGGAVAPRMEVRAATAILLFPYLFIYFRKSRGIGLTFCEAGRWGPRRREVVPSAWRGGQGAWQGLAGVGAGPGGSPGASGRLCRALFCGLTRGLGPASGWGPGPAGAVGRLSARAWRRGASGEGSRTAFRVRRPAGRMV